MQITPMVAVHLALPVDDGPPLTHEFIEERRFFTEGSSRPDREAEHRLLKQMKTLAEASDQDHPVRRDRDHRTR